MTYVEGILGLSLIIRTRTAANLYRNNTMTFEQAEVFPLRIP